MLGKSKHVLQQDKLLLHKSAYSDLACLMMWPCASNIWPKPVSLPVDSAESDRSKNVIDFVIGTDGCNDF